MTWCWVAGFEKLYSENKQKTFSVFQGAVDTEAMDEVIAAIARNVAATSSTASMQDAGTTRSLFMDIYASMARNYMQETGATARHFAMISAKNSLHGSLNPRPSSRPC